MWFSEQMHDDPRTSDVSIYWSSMTNFLKGAWSKFVNITSSKQKL